MFNTDKHIFGNGLFLEKCYFENAREHNDLLHR